MAKSPDMGGQTLAQHTWEVLSRMAGQRHQYPYLTEWLDQRFWNQAFWAAMLHDFGKAAAGFQAILRGEKNHPWREQQHRHEVLSLGFVDWLFPRDHPDRIMILAMVAFHHKDASPLFDKYGGRVLYKNITDQGEKAGIKKHLQYLAANIDRPTRRALWDWLDQCAQPWAEALGFTLIDPPSLLAWEQAEQTDLAKSIHQALVELHNAFLEKRDSNTLKKAFLARGMILSADHTASAGVTTFTEMPLTRDHAEAPLRKHGRELLDHQRAARDTKLGSALLVAPTGSGKTEAALLWVTQQLTLRPAQRLFYTLPYQASMNAMYQRLGTEILGHPVEELKSGKVETISIRHSRALLKRYQDMMSLDERHPAETAKQAKWLKNKTDLNTYPIQVFSPYQMLKVPYGLKGFETLLLDYTDALFIFDEIHAYEPKRLALIIEFIRWLREEYGARFLVMTATLPPMLRDKLRDALYPQEIDASDTVFEASRRHTVQILDGRLSERIVEQVRAGWDKGQAILVCLNRIADAQRVYRQLQEALSLAPEDDLILLHGRFNGQDRARKEQILLQRAGVGRAVRRPFVCVATQVVEVSLNVDFDTIYSDPAPLEALIQRFGRVNRGRGPHGPTLPVHVFAAPDAPDAPNARESYLPYEEGLVKRSLEVLRQFCDGSEIDEGLVTQMLGEIYQGALLDGWERDYQESLNTFTCHILNKLNAFESGDSQEFYDLFDGIEVLPQKSVEAYYNAREQRGYLEASQYLVNISYRLYEDFRRYGLIVPAREQEGEYADHINVNYHPEYGLQIDEARQGKNPAGY
jgi:CRISPR-associated endonuclease/helicase Cas3